MLPDGQNSVPTTISILDLTLTESTGRGDVDYRRKRLSKMPIGSGSYMGTSQYEMALSETSV